MDKEIYLIDMTALIAGTQFRGQFESRIKSLVDECKDLGNIILVIDEIHNIIGGTSLLAIFIANPCAKAVLPTPGSPIKQGLFLDLLFKI